MKVISALFVCYFFQRHISFEDMQPKKH